MDLIALPPKGRYKKRDRTALVTLSVPEPLICCGGHEPMSPNAIILPARQARKATPRKAISKTTRFEIFKRDGFTCQYCGAMPPKAVLHVEHIVPVAKGGGNSDGNLTTACSVCNAGKGVRDLMLAPSSLAERASLVAEKELQLAGYAAVMEAQRQRVEDDCWTVVRALFGPETNSINRATFQSIKNFVNRLPIHQIVDAADIANARWPTGSKTFVYFCGICWNKIKYPENAE
jgi:5-methylcytosine-specific restriction endonuclease McrA